MKTKEKNFVSAVVYVHNADSSLERFLRMIVHTLEENFEHSEVICVNDRSDDGSLDVIREVAAGTKKTSLSVVNMSYYHGLEAAMNAGIDLAIGDFVFEFDNSRPDFQADEIMRVYSRSLEGFDIVSASPRKKERVSSKLFYALFKRFATLPYHMTSESFRILSRRVINRIGSMNKTVPYRKAVYAASGLKSDHLFYEPLSDDKKTRRDRKERQYRVNLAVDSLILFTEVGYYFAISMTLLMMIMSVFMIMYSLITYFISAPVVGWTTTILFLSVAFFGLFGILTVIIKYLQILIDLVFKRTRYSYESVEKLTK